MTAKDGMPCKRCGFSDWTGAGRCGVCKRREAADYRARNRDKEAERKKKYAANNKEKIESSRSRNSQGNKESQKKWRQKNPDKHRLFSKLWRENNLEKVKHKDAQWKRNNPGRVASYWHKREAKKRGNGGSYTAEEWAGVCARYGNKCLRCGRSDVKLTFDHVIPISQGGTSDISNGQPLCGSCNSAKGDRHIDYRPDAGIARWIQAKLFG